MLVNNFNKKDEGENLESKSNKKNTKNSKLKVWITAFSMMLMTACGPKDSVTAGVQQPVVPPETQPINTPETIVIKEAFVLPKVTEVAQDTSLKLNVEKYFKGDVNYANQTNVAFTATMGSTPVKVKEGFANTTITGASSGEIKSIVVTRTYKEGTDYYKQSVQIDFPISTPEIIKTNIAPQSFSGIKVVDDIKNIKNYTVEIDSIPVKLSSTGNISINIENFLGEKEVTAKVKKNGITVKEIDIDLTNTLLNTVGGFSSINLPECILDLYNNDANKLSAKITPKDGSGEYTIYPGSGGGIFINSYSLPNTRASWGSNPQIHGITKDCTVTFIYDGVEQLTVNAIKK